MMIIIIQLFLLLLCSDEKKNYSQSCGGRLLSIIKIQSIYAAHNTRVKQQLS